MEKKTVAQKTQEKTLPGMKIKMFNYWGEDMHLSAEVSTRKKRHSGMREIG